MLRINKLCGLEISGHGGSIGAGATDVTPLPVRCNDGEINRS
jgi:hypothetical protein